MIIELKGVFGGISREIDPESVLPTREELGLLGRRPGPHIVGALPPDRLPNSGSRKEVES